MSQNHLFSLQEQLKNFGLNPLEWDLQKAHGLYFRIQNKIDEGFVFLGRLEYENDCYRWQSMQLISL